MCTKRRNKRRGVQLEAAEGVGGKQALLPFDVVWPGRGFGYINMLSNDA